MPVDAEKNKGAQWATPDDQRPTGFGRFLRRTSMDELPQLFNVLKGEMSIVGPRPERPVFVEEFKKEIPDYMQKHLVKAGITGWAQVNGWRGDTDLNTRIEYDIYYIENWSILFDLKIIAMTFITNIMSYVIIIDIGIIMLFVIKLTSFKYKFMRFLYYQIDLFRWILAYYKEDNRN